ncbi:MAG: methyl-accepting chemotaxis protein [Lachnospiraceae bacterium]
MFKNMKIARKLIVSFVAVVVIASIASVVGLVVLKKSDTEYSKALVENGFVQGDIGDFNAYLQQSGALTRDVIMMTEEADIKEAQTGLEEAIKNMDTSLEKARKNCQSTEEKKIIERIDAAEPIFIKGKDKAVALGLENRNDEALKVYRSEARPSLLECVAAGKDLMALNVKMGDQVSIDLTKQSNTSSLLIIAVIIVSTAVAVAIALYVSRSISRPVTACAERLVLLSRGDLKSEVPPATSKDETGIMLDALGEVKMSITAMINDLDAGLGEMAKGNLDISLNADFRGDFVALKNSVDTITESLNDIMGQINQSSEQVSSGSDQVSSGAQALSQGATEQASSIEELSASITEISQQVKNNADDAQHANEVSDSSSAALHVGSQQMEQMVQAMEEITNTSNEIGKIIKTIDDIAFQTNILALNAAVEAARAGEAGKGFAVVADEVRNLAGKSAEAAKNTTALIESAITAIDNGKQIADATAESISEVVKSSEEVGSVVQKIAKASNEQASAITQITAGVDQISSVIQTNSATAEESAAASEELSGQSQMLKDLVGKFELKDGAHSVTTAYHDSYTDKVKHTERPVHTSSSKY